MADIRPNLNSRLAKLKLLYGRDVEIPETEDVDSKAFKIAEANRAEIRHLESTLATFQLADAQDRATEAQTAATDEQRRANAAAEKANSDAEKAKGKSEEINFWSRRFLTNVAIANGAGFVAVLSFMVKPDSPIIEATDIWSAMELFGMGTALAASVPILRLLEIGFTELANLAATPKRFRFIYKPYEYGFMNWSAAFLASGLFISGMAVTIGCARGYYEARPQQTASNRAVTTATVVVPHRSGSAIPHK
jgi:hypothetical protein